MEAQYVVEDRDVLPDDGVAAIYAEHKEWTKRMKRLQASMVGARFLLTFQKFQWLQSMKLELSAHAEDDGDGKWNKVISQEIKEITCVDGLLPTKNLAIVDSGVAKQLVIQSLWDDESTIYEAFAGEENLVEVCININRDTVAKLLEEMREGRAGRGWDAFEKLFPDDAKDLEASNLPTS